jgi:hypothetical protein
MNKSHEDAEERERAELRMLIRQAVAEGERLEAEAKALREENAQLRRSRDRRGRNATST